MTTICKALRGWFWPVALLLLAAGCAARKPAPANYVLFPPPPDEPRLQYLMSYGAETELGARGKFSDFIVGKERIYRPIIKPYGVAIKKGKIYVCDTQAVNVSIADLAARKMRYLKPVGAGAFKVPINIAVDDDGTLYITDTGREQVLIFDKDLNYLGAMGVKDEMKPCGIALAGDRLYVTDLKARCVRVYDKASRQLLRTFPTAATEEQKRLFQPTNLATGADGTVYVSDTGGFAIKIYDAQGNHLRTIGELGVTPGRFAMPKGIGVDRENRCYVIDAAAPVAQIFDPEGRLLMWFGEPKSSGPAALYLPAGLTIDYDNLGLFQKYVAPGQKLEYLILVTNQAGPRKVSVYGFLKKR